MVGPNGERLAGPPVGAALSHGRPRERHCYVTGAPGAAGEHSGLLLAWRRGEGGWMALVAYVVQEGPVEGWTLVQQWLPAELVRPAG